MKLLQNLSHCYTNVGDITALLTRYNAGKGNTRDSLKQKTIQVVSCHPQEESLVGWDELCDVPQAVRLALRVVTDWQSFYHLARDWQELQPVSSSRRWKPSGVQEDVGGNTWKVGMTYTGYFTVPKLTDASGQNRWKQKETTAVVTGLFYSLVRLTSLTLNWPTGGLFEVHGGLPGKPGTEVNSTKTGDTDWVSSFTRGLFQKRGQVDHQISEVMWHLYHWLEHL